MAWHYNTIQNDHVPRIRYENTNNKNAYHSYHKLSQKKKIFELNTLKEKVCYKNDGKIDIKELHAEHD